MFEFFRVLSHILIEALGAIKIVFDEMVATILPFCRSLRKCAEQFEKEIDKDMGIRPKRPSSKKKKAA